ncbi:MAG: 60S ribosomal export protein NMD3 [Candidatus Micrarchaeota archaeon]|nr:60S ribosomal export protein NMD3 [Candidatus Micrarchaeota archaeon]
MVMSRQCPKCGVSEGEKDFIGSFCIDCYLSMNMPTLPSKVTIYRCRECGSERYTSWSVPVEEAISHELKSRSFGVPEVWIDDAHVVVKFEKVGMEFRIPLKVKESLCNVCAQKSAGYYEAIIQLRGKYAHDRAFAEKLISELERITFIPKTEELKEGLDIYVGSKTATATILSALGFKLITSNKLYGVKHGRRVYRTTFLVRG